jgi:hypothetical protein
MSSIPQENSSTEVIWEIRVLKWVLYKVFAPLLVMLIIWPIYWFSLGVDYPFEKAYADAGLLIFSALVLMEAAIEGEYSHIKDWRFHLGRHIALILALLSLILFTVVKIDVTRNEHTPDYHKMLIYAWIGWFMAILSGILSIYEYWRASYHKATKKLDSIVQPGP